MLVDELIKKLEPFMGKQVIAYGADRGGYDTIIGEPIVKLCSEMEWLQDQEKDCVVVATTPT